MPQLSLHRLAPQALLNSIAAALLLLTAPALAHGSPAPPSRAGVAVDSSPSAAHFGARLPLTLTFHDRMGTAVFADLSRPIDTTRAPSMDEYRAGDVAYVAAEQRIVVFLTNGSAVPDHGLTLLGRLERGLDELIGCREDCLVELSVASTSSDTRG